MISLQKVANFIVIIIPFP